MSENVNLSESSIVPDKMFWGLFLCTEFTNSIRAGKGRDTLKVFYNPSEIAEEECDGESVFRVPVMLLHDPGNVGKRWVPIFMLGLSPAQKHDLKKLSRKKGLKVFEKHFFKPSLILTYEERHELFEV